MSYAAKGEKIFTYQDPNYPNCTPPGFKRSDHRLKRFESNLDRRAWSYCEEVRHKHFHDSMSGGSRTCIGIDPCHRYVPLEDLIKILTAEKDALINELQQQVDRGDTEEKDALKKHLGELTEEVNKSREMLRKAMNKLQNIDEIVNENKKLQCRLRCSEERVKYLEEKRKNLEAEVADLRSKSQIEMDLAAAQQMLCQVSREREEAAGMGEAVLQCLAQERDELQEKVQQLERELEESKKKEAEIEMLRKQSQSDSLDKEEICRENECYRRKLASMKCLEKQIQDLKKQGRALVDKHKKEAKKAAEQMSKMCQATKELQVLREERDSLRKRVDELASYECQYKKLQRKLQRVDAVIAENEKLNCKLLDLEKMEKENEYLRCRLDAIQEVEMNAAEDKERIMQLQCAVADQEEEMKDLLCQIERLTSGKHEEELERLRSELCEKNSKLKLCEEQLAEIPMLEAEIDELRMKLQCCCKEFPEKKKGESSYQRVEVRFPASSTGIRANYKTPEEKCSSVMGIRREERVDLKSKPKNCQEIMPSDCGKAYKVTLDSQKKDGMSCEEVRNLLQSSKGIISCILEDMLEHQKEMEELEACNQAMKEEIETLKARVSEEGGAQGDEDIETIKELNRQMKAELEAACVGLKQIAALEQMLEKEHAARCAAEMKLGGAGPSNLAEATVEPRMRAIAEEDPEFDCCKALQRETDDLKLQIEALNKLTEELKKENELLRELQQPCPDFSKELDEKCALEHLLSMLQAELDAFKGQKLSDECEALRNELKRVMEQNCQLKSLIACYRQRLELEKKSSELNQMNVVGREGRGAADTAEDRNGPNSQVTPSGMANADKSRDLSTDGQPRVGTAGCDEELKALQAKVTALKQENDNLKNSLTEAEKRLSSVGQPGEKDLMKQTDQLKKEAAGASAGVGEKEDCLKELEKLRKEKDEMAKKLQEAEKGEGAGKGASAGVGEKEKADCLKELEQLRKEKDEMAKKLQEAEKGASAGAAEKEKADCLKELEKLRKEKDEMAKKLQEAEKGEGAGKGASAGAAEKEKADCLKELEQLRKEKDEMAKKLQEAEKGASAGAAEKEKADCLKELEKLRKEKGDLEKQLNEAKGEAGRPVGEAGGKKPASDDVDERIRRLEAENAEKLKKLMEQHEKELADRDKKHNENLNAMKSGYETDIRKLAMRHKHSILRLQELHDDEVQEMNLNYETQMDSMQTQSAAAINDVAAGSAAKARKLAEAHSREMKKAEEKFHEALEDKESEYLRALGILEGSLTQSMQELEALKKEKKGADVDKLKAQHAREMQSARRISKQMVNAVKGKMEEERQKSAAEIATLKDQIKQCECKYSKKKPPKVRDPSCPLDFNEVLEKILEEGLDSLTFNEIALVHQKTCCALEGIVMSSCGDTLLELEPPVGDGCPHTPLLEADKQQLLSKIFALENDIAQKQKQTQETIISMELAIKKERCRLLEVRNSLQNEQMKNSELKSLLTSQTKLQTNLKKERDQLGNQASMQQSLCQEKSKQLDEEMRNNRCLEAEVQRLRNSLKHMSMTLYAERGNSDYKQGDDQLEMMRKKLEQSVYEERRLALQLEKETKCRLQLQCQLQSLRQSLKHMVNLPSVEKVSGCSQNPLEAKSAKERQNLDQINEKGNKIKTKTPKKHKK